MPDGAAMTRPVLVVDEQRGFRGGPFYGETTSQLPNQFGNPTQFDNASNVSQIPPFANMRVLPSGAMATRPAVISVAPSTTPAPTGENEGTAGFYWRRASGSPVHLIITARHVGSVDVNDFVRCSFTNNGAGVLTYSGTTTTSPVALFSQTVPQCFVHFRDSTAECVYIADGSSKLSKWDGTTLSVGTIGAALGLTFVWAYNQRLYGITGTDQTLYWSALNDGDTIGDVASGGGFATIRTFGGGNLIAGATIGGSTLLFHQQGISIFTGTTLDDVSVAAGTQGHTPDFQLLGARSFCVVGGICYAVGKQGLFLITESECQAYEREQFTDLIRVDLQGAATLETVEVIAVHNPRASEVLFVNNTTGNWYGYQYRLGVLATHAMPSAITGTVQSAWLGDDSNGAPVVLLSIANGTGDGGLLYHFDAATTSGVPTTGHDGTSPGTAYSGSVWLRRFGTGAPYQTKSWRRLRLMIEKPGTVTAYAPQNSTPLTTATITETSPVSNEYVVQLGGMSTALDVKVTTASGQRGVIHRALVEGFARNWGGAG